MPKLYISEANATSVYEVLESEVSIGRGAANQVQLRDDRASKRHAVLRSIQGRLKLVDLESKNGTRVNGTFQNQHWLRQGDTLTIGKAVIRFDTEEVGAARPAVPVAPSAAPPLPPKPPAASAAPARAPQRQPQAPQAPQRAAAPRQPAAPARATPGRATPARATSARATPTRATSTRGTRAPVSSRRRDDDYDYDEGQERPGRVRKKGMDSSVIILIGGISAVVLALLFFLVMKPGSSHNKDVWLKANEIAEPPDRDYAAAIAYAERNAHPGERDYDRLKADLAKWKDLLAQEKLQVLDAEASKVLKYEIAAFTRTTGFSPKNPRSSAEIADLLRAFLVKYAGTNPALDIMSEKPGEPWETFRHILRTNAPGDVDVEAVLRDATQKARQLAQEGKYGEALRVYDDLKQTQSVLLQPEAYSTVARKADEGRNALLAEAEETFAGEMRQVESLATRGEIRKARGKLQLLIDTFGVERLVNQARDRLEELR